ncbi:tRNA (guanosine(46)-N7)-methyltransferase TrmB [Nocardioides donggukensis]|uniref:tRNA (guanine-N(7)-)-methyltransferase n=1 Tax=Nocardioides donggukensis TaxID=2774019 RepID=A0A927PYM5_9ACTN|nr:tRNA (guanosine(46)-N7)-methyltransferase TrmB [Nocardioides donggukensis]MBD8868483.1 tRNA (guanosine(46)-N7)-methyltransferase TrmB [Nocardioides donggukensis]
MNEVRPARPHQRLTEDGRRMREVLSYSRRGSRFTPRQQEGWDAHAHRLVIPDDAVEDPDFRLAEQFGGPDHPGYADGRRPLIVEIGCGIGEATVALAATRPGADILGLEVWRPGIADCVGRLGEAGLTNVRMCGVDAIWSLEHLVGEGELDEVWTFFPDPWPKTRHHKRRLVTQDNARLIASRLRVGGRWRLATDWAHYAEQMRAVLDAEPRLEGGVVERWSERPVTRFERKGVEAGRAITDLCYRRVDGG